MRYFAELQYDGTNFHGWQIQPNAIGVQELVENKLSMILNQPISVVGCGRTDTGVHARSFFLHFDTDRVLPHDLCYKLNQVCGSAVHFIQMWLVPDDTHARFSALSRTYAYYINSVKNPFLARYSYHFAAPLDIDAMNRMARQLLQITEFGAFCKSKASSKTNTCRLFACVWEQEGRTLTFRITADRFLRNMVRALVGTMLQVGKGQMSAEEFLQVVDSGNRSLAGESAPAHGLFLEEIQYDQTNWKQIG